MTKEEHFNETYDSITEITNKFITLSPGIKEFYESLETPYLSENIFLQNRSLFAKYTEAILMWHVFYGMSLKLKVDNKWSITEKEIIEKYEKAIQVCAESFSSLLLEKIEYKLNQRTDRMGTRNE